MHCRMNKFTEASSNVENPSLVRSVSGDDRALLKEVLLENLTESHETSIFGWSSEFFGQNYSAKYC